MLKAEEHKQVVKPQGATHPEHSTLQVNGPVGDDPGPSLQNLKSD